MRDFLIANPTEVLLIVNQDAVTPKDFTERVQRAGLGKMLYRGSTTTWPTLGQMVRDDQRLVVLAEEDAGR